MWLYFSSWGECFERKYKMKKKNWIYSLIIILIIVLAIVGLITFVHTKYGNQAENHTKMKLKIIKYTYCNYK